LSRPNRDQGNPRWDEPFGDEPLDSQTVERILALPPFADIDARDFPALLPLAQIVAHDGRLRCYQRNEVIIRKGDYGNSLFVVLEGEVVGLAFPTTDRILGGASKTRKSWSWSIAQLFARANVPEYRPPRLRPSVAKARDLHDGVLGLGKVDIDDLTLRYPTFTLHAPQMFGELAALTRSPRNATVVAAADGTLLLELRWQGLRDIRTWSRPFRERIDKLYQERGLAERLQECSIFHHLDKEALDEIARGSLFETYGNFDWMQRFKREIDRRADTGHIIEQESLICEQGNHVDGLLLINRGFARVSERVDHGERTLDHLSRNDIFGLDEIVEIAQGRAAVTLKASLRAIGYVDVVRIPTSLVCKHVLPKLPSHFRQTQAVANSGFEDEKLRQGMMDFVVDHRFINGENAMVINLDRCVGCDDCVRACAMTHDNNPRFTRHGYAHENAMIVHACMHCTDPVCLIGCPTGAIHREQDSGTIVINDNTCIGCGTCANSCPYNNIKMVNIRDKMGAFVIDRDGQPVSRATKCDLCASQLTGPACQAACPHDALIRVNIRDTKKLLAWLT
jgi:Fe-S-cluster-containing dehydrogenase component/CRP-like cAMP-binding protein